MPLRQAASGSPAHRRGSSRGSPCHWRALPPTPASGGLSCRASTIATPRIIFPPASASIPSRTTASPPPEDAVGSGYADTINSYPAQTASHTDLRDYTVRLMKWRERHCLCRRCDGQGKGNSDQPDHSFLACVASRVITRHMHRFSGLVELVAGSLRWPGVRSRLLITSDWSNICPNVWERTLPCRKSGRVEHAPCVVGGRRAVVVAGERRIRLDQRTGTGRTGADDITASRDLAR